MNNEWVDGTFCTTLPDTITSIWHELQYQRSILNDQLLQFHWFYLKKKKRPSTVPISELKLSNTHIQKSYKLLKVYMTSSNLTHRKSAFTMLREQKKQKSKFYKDMQTTITVRHAKLFQRKKKLWLSWIFLLWSNEDRPKAHHGQ